MSVKKAEMEQTLALDAQVRRQGGVLTANPNDDGPLAHPFVPKPLVASPDSTSSKPPYDSYNSVPIVTINDNPPSDKRFFRDVQRVLIAGSKNGEAQNNRVLAWPVGDESQLYDSGQGTNFSFSPPVVQVLFLSALAAMNNFVVTEELPEKVNGKPLTAKFVYRLGRAATTEDGGNATQPALYIYLPGPMLQRTCSQALGMRSVFGHAFSDYEVSQLGLGPTDFCLDGDIPGRVLLNDSPSFAENLRRSVQSSGAYLPTQKASIRGAIEKTWHFEFDNKKRLDDADARSSRQEWGTYLLIALLAKPILSSVSAFLRRISVLSSSSYVDPMYNASRLEHNLTQFVRWATATFGAKVSLTGLKVTGGVALGIGLGAAIYYSGAGKYIGTDWVADKTSRWMDDLWGEWYWKHFLR